MNEMVERVARAMEAKQRKLIAQPLSHIWTDLAGAAIDAMKVPTPRMMHAGAMEYALPLVYPHGRHPIHSIYTKIIEEALK